MKKNSNKHTKDKKQGDDTMAATARNFVYEVKIKDKAKEQEEPVITRSFLSECKKVAEKYRKKK